MNCRICQCPDGNKYLVKEMMFGLEEEFGYFECANCGCLQLEQIPADMSAYYPENYFSFAKEIREKKSLFGNFINHKRLQHDLGSGDFWGRVLSFFSSPLSYSKWLRLAGCTPSARVLDVGCGNGRLLLKMAQGGMTDLVGIDPFVAENITYGNGVRIYKYQLSDCPDEWRGHFDLIMFHHSFEHMEEPVKRLLEARTLLAPGGSILIRVPVADSYAWRHYREHWFQIDAPRHFCLHTQKSMEHVCVDAGMEIYQVESVGELGQFTCSELYRQGIPMVNAKRKGRDFRPSQLREFRRMTEKLNRLGDGDQSVFFIRSKD
jgi:SAM-dependent methyltransferase